MTIEQWKQHVENIVLGRDNDSMLSKVLSVISMIYGPFMDLRSKCYQANWLKTHRLPCRVFSIGNITLGGTGKTPMAIYLAKLLQTMGLHPAIVSRGYKGIREGSVDVVTDGISVFLGPEEAGDEPCLMASKLPEVPVVVGKDRYAAGMKAWKLFRPDVILCDDAFQHIHLFRDLDLVLLDAGDPVGNGKVFPRGILREPLHQLNRADALIFTRENKKNNSRHDYLKKIFGPGKPVFRCRHEPDTVSVLGKDGRWAKYNPEIIRGKPCTVFSGIANNEDFLRMLTELGCIVQKSIFFRDHHHYLPKELETIFRAAQKNQSAFLITTEKDRIRLPKYLLSPLKIYCLGIRISFSAQDSARFREFIHHKTC